jgi:hypothetical protein
MIPSTGLRCAFSALTPPVAGAHASGMPGGGGCSCHLTKTMSLLLLKVCT